MPNQAVPKPANRPPRPGVVPPRRSDVRPSTRPERDHFVPREARVDRVLTQTANGASAVRTAAYAPATAGEAIGLLRGLARPGVLTGPGRLGAGVQTGLAWLDMGVGGVTTLQGLYELKRGEWRAGLVNSTSGALFTGGAVAALLGAPVLAPLLSAGSCIVPGVDQLVRARRVGDKEGQTLGALMTLAGGLYIGAAAAAFLGAGLAAGVALTLGASAVLVGRGLYEYREPLGEAVGGLGRRSSGDAPQAD